MKFASTLRALIGSTLQFVGLLASIAVWTPVSLATFPFQYPIRYWVITRWTHFNLWWLRVTCGLGYEVRGLEHLPKEASIVLCKHQSIWETLVMQKLIGPQTWVLKREIMRLPLFGWAMALLEPIAIDRGAQREAVRQMIEQGRSRLNQGRWVVVFPEGTRVAPGEKGRYRPGGAMLAAESGRLVVPVAHNAGEYWGRRQFLKRAGTIQVRIGQPIDPKGKNAKEILGLAEDWIETEMLDIARTSTSAG